MASTPSSPATFVAALRAISVCSLLFTTGGYPSLISTFIFALWRSPVARAILLRPLIRCCLTSGKVVLIAPFSIAFSAITLLALPALYSSDGYYRRINRVNLSGNKGLNGGDKETCYHHCIDRLMRSCAVPPFTRYIDNPESRPTVLL